MRGSGRAGRRSCSTVGPALAPLSLTFGLDMTGLLSRCEGGCLAWGSIDGEMLLIYAGHRVATPERSRIGFVESWPILGTELSLEQTRTA
jgi:hypothetical protein